MKEDFNPFDLSAPPKPIEKPKEEVEAPRPKPTVNRVSMGPLFHSRITRVLALVLSIALAALVGYTAVNYYLNKQAEEKLNVTKIIIQA